MKTTLLLTLLTTVFIINTKAQTIQKFDDGKSLTIAAPLISTVVENDNGKPSYTINCYYSLKDSIVNLYEQKINIKTKKLEQLKWYTFTLAELDVNDYKEPEENKPTTYYSKSYYFIQFNPTFGNSFKCRKYTQENAEVYETTDANAYITSYKKETLMPLYTIVKDSITPKDQ